VHLFLNGGPSHLDLFDPKPDLKKSDGKIHEAWKGVLFGSPFKFAKHGKSGLELSELLPQLGKQCRRSHARCGRCTPTFRPMPKGRKC